MSSAFFVLQVPIEDFEPEAGKLALFFQVASLVFAMNYQQKSWTIILARSTVLRVNFELGLFSWAPKADVFI